MSDKLKELTRTTLQLTAQEHTIEVKNQLQYDNAGSFVKDCRELKRKIEDFFKPTIESFKKAKAAAEEGRKKEVERMGKFLSPVEDAIQKIQKRCKDFEDEQFRIQQEKQKKLDEEAKEKEAVAKEWGEEAPEIVPEKAKPEFARTTGLGITRKWQWKVKDENLIPREFLLINEVKLNKFARENQDKVNVPGIEFYFE